MRYPSLDLAPLIELAGGASALQQATKADWRTLRRARQYGMTVALADRYACVLGVHPATLWPDWLRLVERERIAKLRQTNPSYRERQTTAALAYWSEHGEAIKAERRRRYRSDPEYRDRRKRQAHKSRCSPSETQPTGAKVAP